MSKKSSQRRQAWSPHSSPSKSVNEILGKVLEPILARRTGMKLELIKIWPELVGEEFAKTTRPEKILWSKRPSQTDEFEPATLVVACEPANALFFQHELAMVTKRVNEFFGFEAIDRVKIIQKPVLAREETARVPSNDLNVEEEAKLQSLLDEIDDPALKETLTRLGKGIFSRS